ncbi:hypothetical protein [Francisella salimarina]|uniref:hypothetical protein n=1 Tax=Francisella salimarina TaxID=2599927 RepID=UPI003752F6E8
MCSNRLVARSKSDANASNYCRIDELELSDHKFMKVFLKGIKCRVLWLLAESTKTQTIL